MPEIQRSGSLQLPRGIGREQDAPATDGEDDKVAGASSSRLERRELDAPATLWEYFNSFSEIDIRTGGNLPHWEQGAAWCFVTFRLADSLPRAVVDEIQLQREAWRRTHDLQKLSPEERAEYHRLFSERYENLLHAGSGSCVLRDPVNADIVSAALRHFDGERYDLDEFVVMPNHVHVLVKPRPGHGLAEILHSWKSYTANQLNRRLGRTGQVWQHESFDHLVRSDVARDAIRRYIRENPQRAGVRA